MFTRMGPIALIVSGVVLFTAQVYAAEDDTAAWACMKDSKAVVVSGNTAAAKEADCKKQGGKWVKKQTAGSTKGW